MPSAPYITHLSADTIHGICKVDPIDYPEADWIKYLDFKNSLNCLDDGGLCFVLLIQTS